MPLRSAAGDFVMVDGAVGSVRDAIFLGQQRRVRAVLCRRCFTLYIVVDVRRFLVNGIQ